MLPEPVAAEDFDLWFLCQTARRELAKLCISRRVCNMADLLLICTGER
jgi:hypothetical protein